MTSRATTHISQDLSIPSIVLALKADAWLGPQVGLAVLRADGNVFACHADREMAVRHGEVGSSAAVLRAGYSLDCLMLRYAGVNWRDPAFGACNAGCPSPLARIRCSNPPQTLPPLGHPIVRIEPAYTIHFNPGTLGELGHVAICRPAPYDQILCTASSARACQRTAEHGFRAKAEVGPTYLQKQTFTISDI